MCTHLDARLYIISIHFISQHNHLSLYLVHKVWNCAALYQFECRCVFVFVNISHLYYNCIVFVMCSVRCISLRQCEPCLARGSPGGGSHKWQEWHIFPNCTSVTYFLPDFRCANLLKSGTYFQIAPASRIFHQLWDALTFWKVPRIFTKF